MNSKKPLTTAKALDLYFDEHVQDNVVDQKSISNSMRHLKKFFGDKALSALGVPESKAYRRYRQHGVKASTANKELRVLKAAAHHCVRWKHITAAELPAFEKMARDECKEVWLFKDELTHFLESAWGHHLDSPGAKRAWAFAMLAYYTASRKTALEKLTWDQIDVENNRINLSGPKDRQTKKRRPTVPLAPELRQLLRVCKSDSEYILGHKGSISADFRNAAKAAGLLDLPARGGRPAGALTPHVLRHSRATHLLQSGKTLWQVAGLLGDNVQTVTAVYGHHCTEYLMEIFN